MAANKLISKLVNKIDEDNGIALFSEKKKSRNGISCPTNIHALELALKMSLICGISDIAGLSASGKTSLTYWSAANFQAKYKDEAIVIVCSSERRDNAELAERMGVDLDSTIVIKSQYLEDLMFKCDTKIDEILEIGRQSKFKPKILVVWDSVSNTISRNERMTYEENKAALNKSIEKGTKFEMKNAKPGVFAYNNKLIIKNLLCKIYDHDIVMITISHLLEDFDTGRLDTGGGSIMKFAPTNRIFLKNVENIKLEEKGDPVAQRIEFNIVKSDTGGRKKCYGELILGVGFCLTPEDIEWAIERKTLQRIFRMFDR